MPQELVRFQREGDLHFVTMSCFKRWPYFGAGAARDCFLVALERMRVRYGFVLGGYVVMPEHVHLLVSEPEVGLLSTALQAVKLSVTKGRPERPFWMARYYDFNVFTEKKKWRSCGIFIAILWLGGWWGSRRIGCDRVFGIGGRGRWGWWRWRVPGRFGGEGRRLWGFGRGSRVARGPMSQK